VGFLGKKSSFCYKNVPKNMAKRFFGKKSSHFEKENYEITMENLGRFLAFFF
jgi:hypothetical protein